LGWDTAHPLTALNMADINATATDFSVSVACGGGNGYDGRIGLRISSIFVIGFGSFMGMSSNLTLPNDFLTNAFPGALLPIYLARTERMSVPKLAFFIAKYFGSGVIVATAFIHVSDLC
jgi:solute carrier family 39 (zinc transporter), member 1/2/3